MAWMHLRSLLRDTMYEWQNFLYTWVAVTQNHPSRRVRTYRCMAPKPTLIHAMLLHLQAEHHRGTCCQVCVEKFNILILPDPLLGCRVKSRGCQALN
jgi:hypothetical protein